MYEHRSDPLLARSLFLRRVLLHALAGTGIIMASLGIGVAGYRFIAGLSWVDALLNASMILGGMGPVNELGTNAAKIFASLYALFAGIAFVATAGVFAAPVAHRLLHRMHLERRG